MSEELMKRPKISDNFVTRRAAELALPKVKSWYGSHDMTDKEMMEDLERGLDCDGYESAKGLERLGWCVDAGLVSILEDGDHLESAMKEMIRQWVKCLSIKPTHALGDDVIYRGKQGSVAQIFADTAEYGVRTPEQSANAYWRCNYEDVTPVPEKLEVVALPEMPVVVEATGDFSNAT